MFALIIALSVAATVIAMFAMGSIVVGESKAGRIAAWVATTTLAVFVLASLLLSFRLHGPKSHFEQGTAEFFIRQWLIYPGQFASLLLPIASSVAYFTARPSTKPGYLSIFALATVSIPAALVVSLVTGCNYAGACL